MSSQSFNSSVYSGFTTQNDKTGISPQIPLRDASDYVSLIKKRSTFRENKASSPFKGSPSPLYPTKQSNETMLDYAFGRIGCKGCTGGPFIKV